MIGKLYDTALFIWESQETVLTYLRLFWGLLLKKKTQSRGVEVSQIIKLCSSKQIILID